MDQAVRKTPNVVFQDLHPDLGDSRKDIMSGLQRQRKTVNPKWFYDERGSQLFEEITRLPEYYPTRVERDIFVDNREEISALVGQGCLFIEPGSGSSEKVRLLLDALRPSAYVPIDISADFLEESAIALGAEYPWLDIHAVCADFSQSWSFIEELPQAKRIVFYPGSTIGNLEPQVAADFLCEVRAVIGKSGGILVGVDTHKSTQVLNAAYNDAKGITADFNLNILRRLNTMVGAQFDESRFSHHAFYNIGQQRIEMHLVSDREQQVQCNGSAIEFAAGESIHTENSYKYSAADFEKLASKAGLEIKGAWSDAEDLFGVYYMEKS